MSDSKIASAVQDRFAVVICTRGGSPGLAQAIRSALVSQPAPSLVVVVDPIGHEADAAIAEFGGHPRLARVRIVNGGLSCARNAGTAAAEAAGARIVAYTDDDCVATPGWIGAFSSAFEAAPDVAMVFGTTRAAPHDVTAGAIPACAPSATSVHRGIASKHRVDGMGACMAVRVDAWRAVGGFDECLGAGSGLQSAEENDLCLRLLSAGYAVAKCPDSEVIHHGFRATEAIKTLQAGYMRGSGAATAKMVRLYGIASVRPIAAVGCRWLLGRSPVDIGPAQHRWHRLRSFLAGAAAGMTLKIDRTTGRFVPGHPTSGPTE